MPAGTVQTVCRVCRSVQSKARHGDECDYGCFAVFRYMAWNALTRKLVIKHHALVPYLARYRTFDQLTAFCRQLSTTKQASVPERGSSGLPPPF